jgi:hypothetical protein
LISFGEIINLNVEYKREQKMKELTWNNATIGANDNWDEDEI